MKIAFIPIDNRPVCYNLAKDIAQDTVILPERELLGGLQKIADTQGILNWLENLQNIDAVVIALDTIAYGGLIPSRRSTESFEQIKTRIEKLKQILIKKHAKVYAFSSIMRISNNNVNEEEKEYWNKWGKKIFDYSYQCHKNGCESCIANLIPSEIIDDYMNGRKRNFEINKIYLEWQKEGFFDTLVFSKDDCAEYGFNVQEAQTLEKLGGYVKTGADEIPLSLLARAINGSIKIAPVFLQPESKDLISNYEDISIEKCVNSQIELAGCEVSGLQNADVVLIVNNFENRQGEIVMKIPAKPFSGTWKKPDKPYMIADVRFANGADNAFTEKLFQSGFDENCLGYSAWNTSANTLGSLICSVKAKFLLNVDLKKLFAIRLLDDWAYQANVRQMLDKPDIDKLKKLMKPYEKKVFQFLKTEYNCNYKFPWNRLFEVEIELN